MAAKKSEKETTASNAVKTALRRVELSPEAIEAMAASVLTEPLYWFPVRHHSPVAARFADEAIRLRKPKVVFIEGPAEAQDMIQYLVDTKTKPPVAIYCSYRDDNNTLGLAGIESAAPDIPPRFASWYPMTSYSPEYVAMCAAKEVGAKCVFIDLPQHALIKPASERKALADVPPVVSQDAPPKDAAKLKSKERAKGELQTRDDELFIESRFYQQLAQAAGFRSWEEAWDTLFETHDEQRNLESYRTEMAQFCAGIRATTTEERILNDGTLERERHMLRTIRDTLKKEKLKPEQCMVVCGGFHLFLDRDDDQEPPKAPDGTVFTTVAPYSFFRISELSGYGAGNRAPQYYQALWELQRGAKPEQHLIEHVVQILKLARREGEPLSSADAIAICQCARMLASLRNRRWPVLDDIADAVYTCCCKGDPREANHLQAALDSANIGTKLGRVTEKLGHLPIVNDFYTQLDALKLEEVSAQERRINVELDKREELDSRRSVFLHRLSFMEVPLAGLEHGAAGVAKGTLFREKWALKWGPKVEPALIEKNLYGDSIEAAALARMKELLSQSERHAGKLCARLVQAVDMDMPDLVTHAEDACGEAIDEDNRFPSLAQGLTCLILLQQYAVYRNLRRDRLDDLVVRCFDRACFALPDAATAPEDQFKEIVDALLAVAEAFQSDGGKALDRVLFVEHIKSAAAKSTAPYLRGVFTGMLAELRAINTDELKTELEALSRAPMETMVGAGEFLDGIMSVSRTTIMLGAKPLIQGIDGLLRVADGDAFLAMLPKMRGAFERLHARHRDSFASRVAETYGLKDSSEVSQLTTSVAAGVLLARLDTSVATIMAKWSFE